MSYEEQGKMADHEKPPNDNNIVPNVPATILSYKTIKEISLELCMVGLLKNWKDVADFLKFTNNEINGHFANYSGCLPAQHMLNNWIFERDGQLPELVKAFRELKLTSCLEELLADKAYQAALKYFRDHSDDDSDASSGTESISEDPSLQPPTTSDDKICVASSSMPSLNKLSLETTDKSLPKDKQENKKENKGFQRKEMDFKVQSEKASEKQLKENPQKSPIDSIVTLADWPKPTYVRSKSVPAPEKNNVNVSRKYNRSKSEEKKKNKRTKVKKPKFLTKLTLRPKRKTPKLDDVKVVNVQEHYEELKTSEITNLSPLKGDEIPTSIDDSCERPISSSSEDSLPSSPRSQGYGSGLENDDSENKNKRIYVICNPGEPKIFSKAFELYLCFQKKGYQCNIFAMNFNEEVEIGVFRYQMEQFIHADHLFLCVSEELHKIFVEPCRNNPIKDENSKSLRHVSDLMMGFLAKNCCNKNGKIMPILLTSNSRDHIPIFLEGYFAFEWPDQQARMENIIHRRPEFSIPVSHLVEQAPQKVFGLKTV